MSLPKDKPVVGFTNELGKPAQNLGVTAYAVAKVLAGRQPEFPDSRVITDMNKIFRPGMYVIASGAANLDNTVGPTDSPAYLLHIMEDPDGYAKGGHVEEEPVLVTMNARQIRYLSSDTGTPVMTRLGRRDTIIDSFIQEGRDYQVVPTVERINETLNGQVSGTDRYAFVKDIGIWIRYTVNGVDGVVWEPAYTWDLWRPISGNDPIVMLTSNIVGKPYTHYVSYGGYTMELPDANNYEIGARIRLDQWSGTGRVFTKDSVGNILYQKDTVPALKTVGLSDITWHDDILFPDGKVFYKQAGNVWSASYDGTVYLIKRAALKQTTGDVPYRYVLVTSNSDVVIRICETDITIPTGIHVSYVPTEDQTFQDNKTYYMRQVVNGIENFVVATVSVGLQVEEGLYYERVSSAKWYDVNGVSGQLTAADIELSRISTIGTPSNLILMNTDIPSNILGCTSYQFEVAYSAKDVTKKVWSMSKTSDMEAYIARLNDQIGATVNAHTERLANIEATADAIYTDMKAFKSNYMNAERHIYVRDAGGRTVFGDNAKVPNEPLIVFRESEYLPVSSITDESYIIQMFQSRLTPVYHIQKHNPDTQGRTLFLPTPMDNIVGKQVKIILEPRAQIMVYDNNSVTRYGYTFTGAQIETSDTIQLVAITFTLDRVVLPTPVDGRQYELYWTYTREVRSTKAIYQ